MFKKIKDWVLGTKPVEQSTNWPHPEPVVAKIEEPKPVPASPSPVKKPAARNYSKKKPVKN
jgi:hypothetical protein